MSFSIPREAPRQLRKEPRAPYRCKLAGSLLNVVPGDDVANFVSHHAREFRFVIGGENLALVHIEEPAV